MKKLLRKALVIVILFVPLFINTDCKKQKKCGCRGDVLYPFSAPANVYFDDESSIITMLQVGNPYYIYTFCNNDEIRPMLENYKSGDELMVSGNVYWDCNYVMQASSNPYSSYYQYYNIYVTEDIYMDMYGKDDSNAELKKGF